MTALSKKWVSGLVAGALMAVSASTLAAEQKTLHVYNWSDYIRRTPSQISKKKPVLKSFMTCLTPTRCWKAN